MCVTWKTTISLLSCPLLSTKELGKEALLNSASNRILDSIAICRVIPRLPQTIPELRSCLAAKNCNEFRKRDFVHVSSLLFYYCIELSHFRVVHFKDRSTLLRFLLQELQARALCDGEAVTASSRVWRAFRELREGQDQLDWASSLHGIQVRRVEERLRDRHSPSSVVLV